MTIYIVKTSLMVALNTWLTPWSILVFVTAYVCLSKAIKRTNKEIELEHSIDNIGE